MVQRPSINSVFATHKYSWNFEYKWVNNIEMKPCSLIHSYSLQHWFISTGCNEYARNVDIKLIPKESDLNHKQKKKTKQQAEQTHSLLVNILVFLRESYLFCASSMYMLSYGESNSTTSYMLLSMNMMQDFKLWKE